MVRSPNICIMELCTRNQKLSSEVVPGAWAEYWIALKPGRNESAVKMKTKAVIVGFH